MKESIVLNFIIYSAVFRVAIITAGVIAFILGYRLFIRGVMPHGPQNKQEDKQDGTEVGAKIGDVKLTLKNAAPGTCFAFFGAGIIIAMLIQGNPGLVLETLEEQSASKKDYANTKENTPLLKYKIELKGENGQSEEGDMELYEASLLEGHKLQEKGNHEQAIANFLSALSINSITAKQASDIIYRVAWSLLKTGNASDARLLAELAVVIDANNPAIHDTLAHIHLELGNYKEAMRQAEIANEKTKDKTKYLDTKNLIEQAVKNSSLK